VGIVSSHGCDLGGHWHRDCDQGQHGQYRFTPINRILAAIMFGNAGIFILLGLGIRKQKRLVFYQATIYLFINLILTIMGDFGTVDLLYLIFATSLLIFLVITRSNYLAK
jgi:hypothetical protein